MNVRSTRWSFVLCAGFAVLVTARPARAYNDQQHQGMVAIAYKAMVAAALEVPSRTPRSATGPASSTAASTAASRSTSTDGTIENYYLVFPSTRGTSHGALTLGFETNRTDTGSYGAFTRSKAFVDINNAGAVTQYRLRTTTYAGVRSGWGPLKSFDCQTGG